MKRLIILIPVFVFLFAVSASAQDIVGKVFWRGMVDDRLQLHLRADQIETRTISGTAKPEGIYSFTSPLPERAVVVDLIRKKGRSKQVRVIRQPSADNDFTAIVEIYDDGGGAKEYQLEIFWR
ncbi:MAG TPA: hypothetical protein VK612_02015 [Pyrinomonadaceae bacterium]|nr:hypothetical protein [Pyrinomonadaceae bacterium]